ncbi:MAG: hypothetical protein ACHQ5A_13715 [Opitutales bacterium]
MRRSKELMILLAILVAAMVAVLWYVNDRRARMRAAPPVAHNEPVDLTKHDGQTIDFSSGRPVVKDNPADKAALDAGLKDIDAATANVTFEPPKKTPEPPPAPPPPGK